MNKEKVFNTILLILFLTFIGIYVTNASGYQEYEMYKKTELTKEQIEKFENDIKDSKSIDINDYINDSDKNYANNFSKRSLSISNFMGKYIKKSISSVFDFMSKLLS